MIPPFPTVPLTVDIIIETPMGIVLVKRRDDPQGYALPGGFVNPDESAAEAAIREAKEETGLDVVLVEQFHTYTKPGRDPRGPCASVVFRAAVAPKSGPIKAGDDAADVMILDRVTMARPEPIAFDHNVILDDYFAWTIFRARPNVDH